MKILKAQNGMRVEKKKNNKNFVHCKTFGGYLTVEAAMVFPIVLGVVLLIIYMWFFQYDRCINDMETANLLVFASEKQQLTNDERLDFLKNSISDLIGAPFVAWNYGSAEYGYEKGKLEISVSGNVDFPFEFFISSDDEKLMTEKNKYSAGSVSKILIIRTFRKLEGLACSNQSS